MLSWRIETPLRALRLKLPMVDIVFIAVYYSIIQEKSLLFNTRRFDKCDCIQTNA
jgi:hypothetical protein